MSLKLRPLNNIFTRPYPTVNAREIWKRASITGFLVFLILFLLKPFGLDGLPFATLLFDTIGYGLITATIIFATSKTLPLLFPKYFEEDHWTVGKEVISITFYTILIAIGNYSYNVVKDYTDFTWEGFFFMLLSTASIAAIVVSVVVLLQANRSLKRNLQSAKSMSHKIHTQTPETLKAPSPSMLLPSEVESQSIELHPERIVCLVSDANYIDCIYLDSKQQQQKNRIRNRMRSIEELLQPYPYLFRCHRAFIVNTNYIEKVDGNAKGYILQLNEYDTPIPVARSKGKKLKELLD